MFKVFLYFMGTCPLGNMSFALSSLGEHPIDCERKQTALRFKRTYPLDNMSFVLLILRGHPLDCERKYPTLRG